MRLATIATFASFCALLGLMLFGLSRPKDAIATAPQPPAQRTGAPGENTCGSCHTGTLLADGHIDISLGLGIHTGRNVSDHRQRLGSASDSMGV